MNINDVILESYGDDHVRILGQFRPYQGASQTGLYISNFFTDLGVTTEDAIAVLSDRYSAHVNQGRYSKHNDGRSDFSADDRHFIRTTFTQLPETYFR